MPGDASPVEPAGGDTAVYRRLCGDAVAAAGYALSLRPLVCLDAVDAVERAVVRLRDRLIEDLRREPVESSAALRAPLEQVNMALSLIVGVEYPATGSQRKPLELALDTLNGIRF